MPVRRRLRLPSPAFARPAPEPGGEDPGPGDPTWTRVGADEFSRTVTNGWGTADTGGAWAITDGSASLFSTNGAVGSISISDTNAKGLRLGSLSKRDVEIAVALRAGKVPTGSGSGNGLSMGVHVRADDDLDGLGYRFVLIIGPAGVPQIRVQKVSAGTATDLVTATLPGYTIAAGNFYWLRCYAVGASPTNLKMRFWWNGESEPSSWRIETTDSTSGIQVAGNILWRARVTTGITNLPFAPSLSEITVDTLDA